MAVGTYSLDTCPSPPLSLSLVLDDRHALYQTSREIDMPVSEKKRYFNGVRIAITRGGN